MNTAAITTTAIIGIEVCRGHTLPFVLGIAQRRIKGREEVTTSLSYQLPGVFPMTGAL